MKMGGKIFQVYPFLLIQRESGLLNSDIFESDGMLGCGVLAILSAIELIKRKKFLDFVKFLLIIFFIFRFHELQDRITPIAYKEYSASESCPETCQYSEKEKHYHCIWVSHSSRKEGIMGIIKGKIFAFYKVQRNHVITTAFVPQDSAIKMNLPL